CRRPDRALQLAGLRRCHPTGGSATVTRTHASPLVRSLRDPSRALAHTLTALEHNAARAVPLALGACALVATALAVRLVLTRLRERRLARGARLLQIAVPPELEAEGALLLWSALHDLLRPRLAR